MKRKASEMNLNTFQKKVIEAAKTIYYRLAGWDETTGNPKREQLESIGLGELAGSY